MEITLPSKSNTYGTLAGLVAGFVTTKLATVGVVASVAVFFGTSPEIILGGVGILVASAVNYGVTHWRELKTIDDLVASLPSTYRVDPVINGGVKTPNNLQKPV